VPFHPCGDIDVDMQRIRAFYADKVGRYPEKTGEIVILPAKPHMDADSEEVAPAAIRRRA
ncbi:MAG TPA: hypothetical protein VFY81_09125, partial [Gammaproteobacteria bacterium]|nr:hypothetical protein [Gammaproteobacteria bacterium]